MNCIAPNGYNLNGGGDAREIMHPETKRRLSRSVQAFLAQMTPEDRAAVKARAKKARLSIPPERRRELSRIANAASTTEQRRERQIANMARFTPEEITAHREKGLIRKHGGLVQWYETQVLAAFVKANVWTSASGIGLGRRHRGLHRVHDPHAATDALVKYGLLEKRTSDAPVRHNVRHLYRATPLGRLLGATIACTSVLD